MHVPLVRQVPAQIGSVLPGARCLVFGTIRTGQRIAAMSPNGDIHLCGDEVARNFYRESMLVLFVGHIMNVTTFLAEKMTMLRHIGTVACCGTFHIDLLNQATLHQCVQRVIHGCHGDFRHVRFGAQIDIICCWVIGLIQQSAINMFTLSRHPQTAVSQLTRQIVVLMCRRLFRFHVAERNVVVL